MESIFSLAKKHCHCGTNIICAIVLTLFTAVNIIQTLILFEPIYVVLSTVTAIITLFSWIYIAGFKIGCTLIKIPLAIITVIGFVISLFTFTIGIVFVNHNGVEDFINEILSVYGYRLAMDAKLIGVFFIIAGLLIFGFSFTVLEGIRYYNSIKCCLDGHAKRSGARVFGVSAIVIFVIITCLEIAYTVFLILSNQFSSIISEYQFQLLYLKLIFTDLLFLLIGISANSFSNQTYAFNVWENQMIKIESNADGTVYVPVNDNFEFSSYNKSSTDKNSENDGEKNKNRKPLIKEGMIIPDFDQDDKPNQPVDQPIDEKDII